MSNGNGFDEYSGSGFDYTPGEADAIASSSLGVASESNLAFDPADYGPTVNYDDPDPLTESTILFDKEGGSWTVSPDGSVRQNIVTGEVQTKTNGGVWQSVPAGINGGVIGTFAGDVLKALGTAFTSTISKVAPKLFEGLFRKATGQKEAQRRTRSAGFFDQKNLPLLILLGVGVWVISKS